MVPAKDISGQRFGRLIAIEHLRYTVNGNTSTKWRCICDCGNEVFASRYQLEHSTTKSCGCLKRDNTKERNIKRGADTRGMSNTRLYYVWKGMKQRCNDETFIFYKDYGARGIKLCPEWENSYQSFREWAVTHGYSETAKPFECTIDRINNDKGYSPDNCRWVPMSVQNKNKRKRHSNKR